MKKLNFGQKIEFCQKFEFFPKMELLDKKSNFISKKNFSDLGEGSPVPLPNNYGTGWDWTSDLWRRKFFPRKLMIGKKISCNFKGVCFYKFLWIAKIETSTLMWSNPSPITWMTFLLAIRPYAPRFFGTQNLVCFIFSNLPHGTKSENVDKIRLIRPKFPI